MDIETLKLANDYTDKHSGGSGGYGPDNVTVGLTVNNTLEVKDNSITDEKLKSLNELKTLIKNNFYDASKVAINILKYRITQLQFDDLINQVKSENIIADFCFETPWGDGNADPTIAQLKEKGVKYATTISEGYVNTFTFTNAFDNHKQRVKNLTTEISIILNEVSPFMSILDQIVYIHEWLCKHVKYDVENSKRYYNYNVYNCLVNKVSVCGGYSRVTELLFTLLGIPCSIVASTWAGHVWNIVQLDGHWYNFDATDDGFYPQVSFYENMLISTSVKYAMLQAEYLMESNDTVDIYTGLTPVSCTDTTYDNYWWRNVQGQLLFSHIYPNYWFYIDPTTNNIVDSLIDGTDKEVLYENTEYIEVDESTHITAFSYESILMHNLFILRGGLILRIGTDGLVEDSYSIPNSSEHIFKGIVLSEDCSSAHCFYVWDADDNTWNGVWYDTSETVNIAKVLNSSISESKLSLGVQEKLNNIINIKSFGAVGDGITNDTNAFISALTTANGRCVIVPGNGNIYNVDNITLNGVSVFLRGIDNPLIQLVATSASHQILDLVNPLSVEITGCIFDGNRIALGDSLDETILDFMNPNNVNIHHNTFRNVSREATVCRGTIKNIDVHHNVYENVSAHLWCFQGSADNIKFNNNVSNVGRTHGLEFEQCPTTRVQMLDNQMDSVTSACALFETVKYAIVKGNSFKNCQYGVLLKASVPNTADDGVNYQCDEIIIDDNYFGCSNALYSTAVVNGIKQYGTIIFKNNTCKLSSAMISFADAKNVKLINNTNVSTSANSQQYKFTNVGTVEVDGLSHVDSVLTNANYLFYFTGVTTVILNNLIAKSLAKLYSFVTTDATQFYFKNMIGNFGDILRTMKLNANVVNAMNCTDTSSTIGTTSAPASSTVDVPALGTYFTATPTAVKTITSITTNAWMGRRIYIQSKAFALTYTPSATLLTKSGTSVVVGVDSYISLEYNGFAWCEV